MITLNGYNGARVLVTGSEGFVGRHLCARLVQLGARVDHFDLTRSMWREDVRSFADLRDRISAVRPRYVFHLAAQAFVPEGYGRPRYTWHVNTLGTVNLLDALREGHLGSCAVVVVTTDKVYGDTTAPVTEDAPLNGRCPYSASKVAAERAVESFRASYYVSNFDREHRINIATARAGNIIGPGDHYGVGRLVPSAIEALHAARPVPVYNPRAVRPWQAIQDVIEGYLLLGAALARPDGGTFQGAWNFGPRQHHTVIEVVERVIEAWGSGSWEVVDCPLQEVNELRIDSGKAACLLGWAPQLGLGDAIEATVASYRRERCSDREGTSST